MRKLNTFTECILQLLYQINVNTTFALLGNKQEFNNLNHGLKSRPQYK